MYNVNKGGNTLDESEILEPLHACLRELLERDKAGKGHLMRYSDEDVIAVTLLYTQILSNRFAHVLSEEDVNIKYTKELAANFGAEIRNITLAMTRVDTSMYYKKRGTE